MDSVVEARVRTFLQTRLHYTPHDCGAIIFNMRHAARVAGYDLDERFGQAGLAAGPDARVASGIVNHALDKGGDTVSEDVMKQTIDRWLQTSAPMGTHG